MPLVELGLLVDEQTGQAPQGVDPARGILLAMASSTSFTKDAMLVIWAFDPPTPPEPYGRSVNEVLRACMRKGKALYFRCQLWFAALCGSRSGPRRVQLFLLPDARAPLGTDGERARQASDHRNRRGRPGGRDHRAVIPRPGLRPGAREGDGSGGCTVQVMAEAGRHHVGGRLRDGEPGDFACARPGGSDRAGLQSRDLIPGHRQAARAGERLRPLDRL